MSILRNGVKGFFSLLNLLTECRENYSYFYYQKNSYNQPSKIIRKARKMGFTADEYLIYDLEHNDYRDYLSEYDRKQFRKSALPYKIIMDNKILFNVLVSQYGRVNKLYAYKMDGIYTALEDGFELENIIRCIKERNKVVFKLESGPGGGAGFRLFEYVDGDFLINKERVLETDILTILFKENNYLLEEFCEQSEFEKKIFPSSVNTMRLITVRQKNGEYELIAALHRFGSRKNACVDNASSGGLFSKIDIDTGKMTYATSYDSIESINTKHSVHPITHSPIEGVVIPCWPNIKEEICELHKKIAFTGVPFIAWDVALLDDGICIIEGNTSCGFKFLQKWHGERNGKVGKWMKDYGFIK